MRRQLHHGSAVGVLIVCTALALRAQATDVKYVYDELGRLVAVTDAAGDSAVYSYDAVGNLLSIARYTSSQVAIFDFTPNSGPVGTTVTIRGSGFNRDPGQQHRSVQRHRRHGDYRVGHRARRRCSGRRLDRGDRCDEPKRQR